MALVLFSKPTRIGLGKPPGGSRHFRAKSDGSYEFCHWTASDRDPLDFVERNRIVSSVIELGGTRALVRGHGLGVLKRSAGLEIGGDAGRTEHMAAEFLLEAGFGRAPADHTVGVDPVHRLVG